MWTIQILAKYRDLRYDDYSFISITPKISSILKDELRLKRRSSNRIVSVKIKAGDDYLR